MFFRIQSQPSYSKLRRTCSLLVTIVVDKCKLRTLGFGLFPKIILIHNYSHDRPIAFRRQMSRKRDSYSPCLTAGFSSVCKGKSMLSCLMCVPFLRVTFAWSLTPRHTRCIRRALFDDLPHRAQALLRPANPSKGRHPRVLGTKILFLFCLRAQSACEARVIKK